MRTRLCFLAIAVHASSVIVNETKMQPKMQPLLGHDLQLQSRQQQSRQRTTSSSRAATAATQVCELCWSKEVNVIEMLNGEMKVDSDCGGSKRTFREFKKDFAFAVQSEDAVVNPTLKDAAGAACWAFTSTTIMAFFNPTWFSSELWDTYCQSIFAIQWAKTLREPKPGYGEPCYQKNEPGALKYYWTGLKYLIGGTLGVDVTVAGGTEPKNLVKPSCTAIGFQWLRFNNADANNIVEKIKGSKCDNNLAFAGAIGWMYPTMKTDYHFSPWTMVGARGRNCKTNQRIWLVDGYAKKEDYGNAQGSYILEAEKLFLGDDNMDGKKQMIPAIHWKVEGTLQIDPYAQDKLRTTNRFFVCAKDGVKKDVIKNTLGWQRLAAKDVLG